MGSQVSVVRISSVGHGLAYSTTVPRGELPRSTINSLEELGYGRCKIEEKTVVNFLANNQEAERQHKLALELIRKSVPKDMRDQLKMELKPSRVKKLQAAAA